MRTSVLSIVALVSLLTSSGLSWAWGPFTHETVNLEVVRRLPSRAELLFLRQDQIRVCFVTSGALPDLTMSILAGGKTDPEFDSVFHASDSGAVGLSRFPAHLLARAVQARSNELVAAALGWCGHLAADRVGHDGSSGLQRNIFELPGDVATEAFAEILVDGVMLRRLDVNEYVPKLDKNALVAALYTYAGPRALTGFSESQIRSKVDEFDRKFRLSLKILHQISHLISVNQRLVGDLTGPILGSGDEYGIVDIGRSVQEVANVLQRAPLAPSAATGPGITPFAEPPDLGASGPGPGAVTLLGVGSQSIDPPPGQDASDLPSVSRTLSLFDNIRKLLPVPPIFSALLSPFRWLANETIRVVASAVIAILHSRLATRLDLKKRMFLCFCLEVAKRDCSFADLKRAVRKNVPEGR